MSVKPKRNRTKPKVDESSSSSSLQNSSRITVAVRARPLLEKEAKAGSENIVSCLDGKVLVLRDPSANSDDILRRNRSQDRRFAFDHVLDHQASQKDVYCTVARPLLKSFVAGYNCTVFAYGPTSAGKTYSMLGTPDSPGIMFLTMVDLFKLADRRKDDYDFEVTLQYVELYNENLYDLLVDGSEELDLRDDADAHATIIGATTQKITSAREVMKLLTQGNHRRTQEATAANATSSRSHAILHLELVSSPKSKDTTRVFRKSSFYMCDLAGSERAAQTKNRGIRMVEGQHINRSLLALGNCINALSAPGGRDKYTNFRDSKLTRMLKDALSGNCRTAMIAHVSPATMHFEESYNTLNYARRAKTIKTSLYKNVEKVDLHIDEYTKVIATLKSRVASLQDQLGKQKQQQSSNATRAEIPSSGSDTERIIALQYKLDLCLKDALMLYEQLHEQEREAIQIALDARDRVITLISPPEDVEFDRGMTLVEAEFERLGSSMNEVKAELPTEAIEDEIAASQSQLTSISEAKQRLQREIDLEYQRAQEYVAQELEITDNEGTRMIMKNLHELHRSRLREASASMMQHQTAQALLDLRNQVELLQSTTQKQSQVINQQTSLLASTPPTIKRVLRNLQADTNSLAALQQVARALPLPAVKPTKTLRRNTTFTKRRKGSAKPNVHIGTAKVKRQANRAGSGRHRSERVSPAFSRVNSSSRPGSGLAQYGETYTQSQLKDVLVKAKAQEEAQHTSSSDNDDRETDTIHDDDELSDIGSDDPQLASALEECKREEAEYQQRQAELRALEAEAAAENQGNDEEDAFAAVLRSPPIKQPQARREAGHAVHTDGTTVMQVALETGVSRSIRSESTDNKQRPTRKVQGTRATGASKPRRPQHHVPDLGMLTITASPYARPIKQVRKR
eukprot:TRINITY_DN10520_c0_g1_i6.p1 TRINITY_DN10520_c0_g1~~TRINITY_DN10520_c0_g1_i6.p1  ORF type:complete len:912 (+),score=229.97 TRINITY_DN10520_c0_g1_i6:128-2863(+)